MDLITKTLLFIHVATGGVSLVLFWLPVVTKKGGKIHNRIGILHVYAIWVVVITAFLLSVKNLMVGNYTAAGFLGFLTILTSAPLWYAKAILKHKKGITKAYFYGFKVLHTLIFVSGAGLVLWAILLKVQGAAILMLVFGILGLTAFPDAFSSFENIQSKEKWVITHLRGMLSTGIAAYTAFFAFGGRQFFEHILTDQWMVIPWVLPSIIGAFGIRYWRSRYTPKPKTA
jgi:hypothetical protein